MDRRENKNQEDHRDRTEKQLKSEKEVDEISQPEINTEKERSGRQI